MTSISTIWSSHKTRLRGYVAKRVRDPNDVDDILQDVFLKAFENVHSLKARGSVTAWLYRITTNAISDHYRSQQPQAELPDDFHRDDSDLNPMVELAMCLQPFIDDLPDTYRDAIILSEIQGLPQKEVSAQLNISYSGTKSRVQRGREKLRQLLLDCCTIETGTNGIVSYEQRDRCCDEKCS